MKKKLAVIFASLGFLTLSFPSFATGTDYKPVAIVNDVPITPLDIENRVSLLRVMNNIPDTVSLRPQDEQKILSDIIDEVIKQQEAQRFKVEVSQDRIDEVFMTASRNIGLSPAKFIQKLESKGLDRKFFDKLTERKIAWDDLVQGRYARDITISTHEISQIIQETSVNDGAIVSYNQLRLPYDGSKDSQEKIKKTLFQISEKLNQGNKFELLAKNFSEGDVGVKNKSLVDLPPQLAELFKTLAIGQISQPIQIDGYVTVVELLEKEEGQKSFIHQRMDIKTGVLEFDDAFDDTKKKEIYQNLIMKSDLCNEYDDYFSDVKHYDNITFARLKQELVPVAKAAAEGETRIISEEANQWNVLTVCHIKDIDYYHDVSEQSRKDIRNQLLSRKLSLKEQEYLRDLKKSAVISIYR